MNGRERVLAMIEGHATDRLPLMPITMMYAGDLAGVLYRDYATDGRVLAEAQIRTAEEFGFDYVSSISDPAREAADLGAAIEWFENQPPAIIEERALISDKSVLSLLSPTILGARMADRLKAIRILKERAGSDLLVEGWVEGPCALGADLRGLNTLMFDFSDDPEFVRALFEFTIAVALHFARVQIQAGADLIGIGDAAASLVGPRLYREFVVPSEQRLIAGIRSMGGRTRLHICGNTRKVLADMGTVGADIVDLDYPSPLAEGRAVMGPGQVLLGNIHPVRVLRDGTPADVERELSVCFEGGRPRYIVGAGCEIPRGTPPENVQTMNGFAQRQC